jgi:hypothetical protein
LQTFQQEPGGHEKSPDRQWAGPSKADKQCDSKITEKVIDLPT